MKRFHFLAVCGWLGFAMSGCGGPTLPKTAPPPSPFTTAMHKMERGVQQLKLCQAADWKAPPDHPEIVPREQAAAVKEGLQEAGRTPEANRNEEFKSWLREAEGAAESLEESLQGNMADELSPRLKALDTSCQKCHAKYRS